VALSEFSVVQPEPEADKVAVCAHDGPFSVIAVIPRDHLRNYFHRDSLSSSEAALLVRSNLDALSGVICRKYESGDYRVGVGSSSPPRIVYFKPEDVRSTGKPLTDSILNARAGWAAPDGRW
jgi:hypothetical protein